jgi:hypothetical protein
MHSVAGYIAVASFFWTHYYAFLTVVALLLLVGATVALVCEWIERGDFITVLLEVVVIVMIGVEIKEGHDQGAVLDALNASASATATTLQGLESTQQDSAATLGHMNDSMRQQARTTESMNGVLQQQLAVVSSEQKARLEQAKLHPVVEITVAQNGGGPTSVLLFPNAATVARVNPTPYTWVGDGANRIGVNATGFEIRNTGNAPLKRPKFTARVGLPNRYRCLEFLTLDLSVQTKRVSRGLRRRPRCEVL